jgi:WS/DGAT/MGAT family acyltransferase
MSLPLRRDRPLWEMWVCENPSREQFALIGKAHHCMVDGLAAVELGSLLLDDTPQPAEREPDEWSPSHEPSSERLLLRGMRDLAAAQLGLLRLPVQAALSPARAARQAGAKGMRVARALSHSLLAAAPDSVLNHPLSPLRRLAWTERPLDDLQTVKRTYGTTINDVMLAAVAGGMRAYLADHGERPIALKAMVPVSVRNPSDVLGNHISFVFAELPCEEPDPLSRLYRVHAAMSARKRDGEPEGADIALQVAEHTPAPVQHALTRIIASPRTFNLVVSNIPGPREQLYIRGCPLQRIYPVVPLADRHTVSVGMTTVCDRACFGVYADREALPDAELLARDIGDELNALGRHGSRRSRTRRRAPVAT